MSRIRLIALAACALATPACTRRAVVVDVDEAAIATAVAERLRVPLRRVVPESPFAVLVNAVAEDDRFKTALFELVEQLPEGQLRSVGARLQQRAHLDEAFDGRVLDALGARSVELALIRASRRFILQPSFLHLVDRVARHIAHSASIGAAVSAALALHRIDQRWADALARLNDGSPPTRERATELVLRRAFGLRRLTLLCSRVSKLPSVHDEAVRLAVRVLGLPSVHRIAAAAVGRLAQDQVFLDRAADLFVMLGTGAPTPAAAEDAVKGLYDHTETVVELTRVLEEVADDPAVEALARESIGRVTEDALFQSQASYLLDALLPWD